MQELPKMALVMQLICKYLDRETIETVLRVYPMTRHAWKVLSPVWRFVIENNSKDWNEWLCHACRGGDMEMLKLILETGVKNWDGMLYHVYYGGPLGILNLIMNGNIDDLGDGLYNACSNGHVEIKKLIAKKIIGINRYTYVCSHCDKSVMEHQK